jgi:hypothetical protein
VVVVIGAAVVDVVELVDSEEGDSVTVAVEGRSVAQDIPPLVQSR